MPGAEDIYSIDVKAARRVISEQLPTAVRPRVCVGELSLRMAKVSW
jgi:hypothetical protein